MSVIPKMAATNNTRENQLMNPRKSCSASRLRKRSDLRPARSRLTVTSRPNAEKILHSNAIATGMAIAAMTAFMPRINRIVNANWPILWGSRLREAESQALPMCSGPRSIAPAETIKRPATMMNVHRQRISMRKSAGSRHTALMPCVMGLGGLVICLLSFRSALKSTDHHVYQLARHKNHLHHLLICNGGTNFFVRKHTLAHHIFRAVRRENQVAAELAVDLDGIGDLVFFGQRGIIGGPGITKQIFLLA